MQNGNLILRYYLDAAQRVVGVDRFGGAPAMARYWYDELGNLVKTQDAAGNITIHVVDSRSRLAKLAEPHGADLNVSYAGFAQPSQVAVPGAAGDLIHTITYDTKGRIQEVAQQVDGVTKPYVKFTYDELIGKIPFTSDLIPKFGLQRTTHVTDPHGEYDYFYEPDGGTFAITRQLVGIPGVPDLPPLGSVHVRDGFSNPVQTAYPSPSGFKVKYATDVLGRLGKVTDGSGKTFASYSYDAGGELQAMTYGNGIAQSFTYHPTGRIASMRLAKGDKELLYERYNYDGVGRKTEILHGDGARVTYAYDGRGDLLKVEYYKAKGDQPYYVQAYTYDANGNRLSYADNFRLMTYTYKGNQLTEYTTGPTGKVALTYDPQGRVLHEEERSDNTVVLARDYMDEPHGRLMELTIQDAHTGYQANIAYQYDAQGRREVKTVNGVPTIYYYGDDAYPLSEFQADPKNPAEPHERHYIYAGGHRIAVLDGTEIRYFHDIDLRSPVATTDQSGKVRHRIRFDPFGNATFELGNNPYGFGFMGEQHDAESGLYYMGDGSYYDPRTGRYLNRTDDSLNAYRFPLGQSAAGQEVVFDNMPSPETGTGFLDIKATPVAIASVAQFAQEGVDDVGGAGFVCVNVSVSNVGVDVPLALRAALVPGNALFGSGNVSINGAFSGCADAGEPFGTATSVIGNKIKGEAAEAAKGAAKAWIRKALWQNLLFPANPMTALVSVLNALYEIYKVLKSIGDFLGGFFGLGGVSYEVLDHPPEGFSDIQIFSLQNNRLLFDPSFLSRLTPYFTVGQKSFVYLQLLEDIGVAPQANYSPTVVGPFGLRNAVIKPIDQFRVSGQFTGGAFLGWSYMKFGP
ncbi:MAG: RHS repeat protein [Deltaproteobacteria bacterium]|nr:RHS repeat protein [Deltaproteobacteria bacterium]